MSGYVWDEEGHFLSQEHLRIAEIIQDYNPTLELAWIPPENRLVDDKELPFAVICKPPGKKPYVVFQIKEDEVDHRVLQRIFEADTNRTDVLSRMEKQEAALRLMEMKRQMDEAEERKAFVKSVFSSPKSVYKHNGVEYR